MARPVRNWLITAAVGCALAALAFLLLGERAVDPAGTLSFNADADIERESRLGVRVRRVHSELYRLQLRDSLLSILDARVSAGHAFLWIDPGLEDVLSDTVVESIRRALTALSARPPRIPVMVALTLDAEPPLEGVPWIGRDEVIHFLPGTTGGRACLSALSYKGRSRYRSWSLIFYGVEGDAERAAALLGPCAYYAAFGQPGRGIERWLEATRYELTRFPLSLTGAETDLQVSRPEELISMGRVWPPARGLVACAAGNAAACRIGVLSGRSAFGYGPASTGGFVSGSDVISTSNYLSIEPLGPNANRWLSDLLADVGAERFDRFWSSEADVDSAFREATGTSLEGWTMGWARAQLGKPRSGPAAPVSASVLALVGSGMLLGAVVLLARRRQSR